MYVELIGANIGTRDGLGTHVEDYKVSVQSQLFS